MREAIFILALASVACDDAGGSPGSGISLDGNVIRWQAIGGFDAQVPDAVAPAGDAGASDRVVRPDRVVEMPDARIPDALDPCLVPPTLTLTASAASRRPDLVGRLVEVTGALGRGATDCSTPPCPTDNPCCAECAAPLLLDEVLHIVPSECGPAAVGCSGNNCTTTCSPPILGSEARAVGRLELGPGDELILELWRIQL